MDTHTHDWYIATEHGSGSAYDEYRILGWCDHCEERLDVLQIETILNAHDELLAMTKENMRKRHDYGIWLATVLERIPSHRDPIESCPSPGCMDNRAVIAKARP